MPRKQDNIAIWKTVVADYTKSDDYDRQQPETRRLAAPLLADARPGRGGPRSGPLGERRHHQREDHPN